MRQAEGAKIDVGQADVGADRDQRAHRAVLIVPGRIGRLAQERIDDRRHPQAPAHHAHRLREQALRARCALSRPLIGRRLRSISADSSTKLTPNKRRGDRPVDHAGKRFGVEQPHAAGDFAKVDLAVFVEQRIDAEIAERAAGQPIVHIGIGPEFGDHDIDLRRVEIPAERAGDEAAEQNAKRIEPPGLQLARARPRRCAPRRRRDRRRHRRARRRGTSHRNRAPPPASLRPRGQRPGGADPDDDAPRIGARIAIVLAQAAEERRRAVGAADDRLDQRKGERASQRRQQQRVVSDEGDEGGLAQRTAPAPAQEHEHAAVDGAFDEAGAPMVIGGRESRRPCRR